MVSKTGKTQMANNSMGIYVYGNMNKYTGKNPLVKHAVQFSTFGPDSCWLDSDPVRRQYFNHN